MPRFRVTMESQEAKRKDKSPHFRVTVLQADDKDAAVALCERRELQIAAHEYPLETVDELNAEWAAAKEAGVKPSAQTTMRVATHNQRKPYVVTNVEEVV